MRCLIICGRLIRLCRPVAGAGLPGLILPSRLVAAFSAGGDGGGRPPKNPTLIRRLRQPAMQFWREIWEHKGARVDQKTPGIFPTDTMRTDKIKQKNLDANRSRGGIANWNAAQPE
jgi:hypothetical protein